MAESIDMQKVLIVDDTPENIQVLMETLKGKYKIVAAINGQKALQMAVMDPVPDIILLDIMMSGFDGYQVCEKLKSDEKTRNIPVIFVTTMAQEDDEQKGLDLGAVDYITKPFRPGIVKSRVQNHLELKRHQDHLEELVRERTQNYVKALASKLKEHPRFSSFLDNAVIEQLFNSAEYADHDEEREALSNKME